MRARHSSSGNQHGFSLVELLVVFALLMVVVLVVSQLIVQSLHLLARSGEALREPGVTMAAAWLRQDVQGSVSVASQGSGWLLPTSWMAESLALRLSDGSRVVFEQDDNANLVRRVFEPVNGEEIESRVLLRGIASWRYRLPSTGLVDCEIRLPDSPGTLPEGERTESTDPIFTRARIERFRFALRQGGSRW